MPWKQRTGKEPYDKCGHACFMATATVIWLNGLVVTTVFVLYPWLGFSSKFLLAFGFTAFLTGMTSWSQINAAYGDPGWVPKDARPLPADVGNKFLRRCRTCDAFKPDRAVHCGQCGHCVVKIDHHCPFINNCVGMLNHKYFLLFIFYGSVLGIYSMLIVALHYFYCLDGEQSCGGPAAATMSAVNVIAALIFCLFSCCVMCDQCQAIASPTVFALGAAMDDDPDLAYRRHLREIFGGHGFFQCDWLVPTTPKYLQFEDMVGFRSESSPWTNNKPEQQERTVLTL